MSIDHEQAFKEEDFAEKLVRPAHKEHDRARPRSSDLHLDRDKYGKMHRSRSPRPRHRTERSHRLDYGRRGAEANRKKDKTSLIQDARAIPDHRHESNDSDDEIGPQLPLTLSSLANTVRPNTDARLVYEEEVEDRRHSVRQRREADKQDRTRERTRRSAVLDELVPKPDPGRATKIAASALRSEHHAEIADRGGAGQEMLDAEVFAEDEIRARMQRDQERREERARIKKVKDLERDEEKMGRVSKMREKEKSNMEILKRLAEKRFGSS